MTNETEVKVWNATSRNLLVGADGILLRPAESMWVEESEARDHIESGALHVIERGRAAESESVEPQPKRSRKKAEPEVTDEASTQETVEDVAPVSQPEQVELNVSDNNQNSEEDVPENTQ